MSKAWCAIMCLTQKVHPALWVELPQSSPLLFHISARAIVLHACVQADGFAAL